MFRKRKVGNRGFRPGRISDPIYEELEGLCMDFSRGVFGVGRLGHIIGMMMVCGFLASLLLALYVGVECLVYGFMGW